MDVAKQAQLVTLRIKQVPMPYNPIMNNVPEGSSLLSGKLTAPSERHKLDTRDMPPSKYKSVRDDLSRYSPIPVSRVALRYGVHAYIGIIDSNNTPYMFSLNSRGLLLRKAPDEEKAWELFDSYMETERTAALKVRRQQADREQATLVVKSVKNPGSRGGTFYFDKHGHVRYGHPSAPKAKHEVKNDTHVHVFMPKDHDIEDEDLAKLHKRVRRAKPASVHDVKKEVRDFLREHYDFQSTSALDQSTRAVIQHFHEVGALHLKEPEAKKGEQTFFKKRQALAKPILPKPFDAKGTTLVVNGKPVRLNADAEHACYTYARRFIVNEGTVKGMSEFNRGFEKSLQAMGVPKGEYDFRNFVARIVKEPQKEKEAKSKEAPTPKTHPHMFIKQDGQLVRLSDVRTPAGNFYTGKGKRGTWARALREEDLTMNVSHGAAPKGWKGKVINDPSKDYYLCWRHPDTDELGYVYPSRATAYQKKFEEAQALGKAIEDMRPKFISDIENAKNPATRAAALCAYLMDKEHFRVGEETHAEDTGTFGVGSFLAEHVKIDGKTVIFDFPGKKDEPWKRAVDMGQMPEALAFIKSCLKGKHKKDKLWEGTGWRVDSKSINAYLEGFSRDGVKFTAKMFRTFHANKYMHSMLKKAEEVEKALKLSPADMKKLYKGFKVNDKAGRKLLATPFKGGTVGSYFGFEVNHGAKGKGKPVTGILPTIATRLGHTISSCRNSYIDPVAVCRFAADRGWDERTVSEKKQRDDLPVYEKPTKEKK